MADAPKPVNEISLREPNKTEADLAKLKEQLKNAGIEEKEDNKEELTKLSTWFESKKSDIQKITKTELDKLAADIKDDNKDLLGTLEVNNGFVEYKEAQAQNPPAAPEEKKPETPEDLAKKDAVAFFAMEETDEIKKPEKNGRSFVQMIGKWIRSFVISIKEMFGMDVSHEKAQDEGYSDYEMQQKCSILLGALSPYMGKGVETLRDPKESYKNNEESLVKLVEGAGIPIKYTRSCMKYIFTGDQAVMDKLPPSIDSDNLKAIRGKYLSSKDGPVSEKSPREKLDDIFTIEEGKKEGYITIAESDKEKREYVEPLAPTPLTSEEEKAQKKAEEEAEIQRKQDEIAKARVADEELQKSETASPKVEDDVKKAKEIREGIKKDAAEKMQSTYKDLQKDLEKIEDRLKVDGIDTKEKASLEAKKKSIIEALGKIKSETEKVIFNIEDNPIQCLEKVSSQSTIISLHAIESIYAGIENSAQTAAQGTLTQQSAQEREETLVEADISKAKEDLQKITDIIGIDGKRSFNRNEIIDVQSKISALGVLVEKVKVSIANKPDLKAKYDSLNHAFSTMKDSFRFKEVGQVKTDYDEAVTNTDKSLEDAKNIDFKKLIAVSPDKDVAYFYVDNYGGNGGYLRLILSDKDPNYNDTGAAFFPENDLGDSALKKIEDMEGNISYHNFSTITLGNGKINDDFLNWKTQTNWKQKIQGLGLTIPEETA